MPSLTQLHSIFLACKCGIEGKTNDTAEWNKVWERESRIDGGKPVTRTGKYPWIVYLESLRSGKFLKRIVLSAVKKFVYLQAEDFCGGTLVASKYVISAAHCMEHQSCNQVGCGPWRPIKTTEIKV